MSTLTSNTRLYWTEPIGNDNEVKLKFRFHKYQKRAMRSKKRFILLLAGTQGGKTSMVPVWLYREIMQKGAGDYLFVAPTFKLMNLKAIPEFLRLFQTTLNLGTWQKGDKVFTLSKAGEIHCFGEVQDTPTRVLFGHAQDPDSLESATAKAAVLDECGQKKFKLQSFEAIMRRLSLFQGRVLMATTPYYMGWLKKQFWDVWQAAKGRHAEIDIFRFPSIANPSFPRAEYERARRVLPTWKFKMFYQGIFTRPAGLIYDCFRETVNKVSKFVVPDSWQRWFIGLDFGGVNTAAVILAAKPGATTEYYVVNEYWAGRRSAGEHVGYISKLLPGFAYVQAMGGAGSEDNWRLEFSTAGLNVLKPVVQDVEIGIQRVYTAFKTGILKVMENCTYLLDEIESYSRKLDEDGNATEQIENKSIYHLLDALRYIMSALNDTEGGAYAW